MCTFSKSVGVFKKKDTDKLGGKLLHMFDVVKALWKLKNNPKMQTDYHGFSRMVQRQTDKEIKLTLCS